MLLERDPANPAPAEQTIQRAIAVAREQGTHSFELRAALSLAKLYQATGRLSEAPAVLTPALEGFTPTPEMPEIAEAQALVSRLAWVCFWQGSGPPATARRTAGVRPFEASSTAVRYVRFMSTKAVGFARIAVVPWPRRPGKSAQGDARPTSRHSVGV